MNYFKIKKYGKVYMFSESTEFKVSTDGISVLKGQNTIFGLKPEDIEVHGVELVDIWQDLEREYKRLTKKTDKSD